ncbi:MAG: hypothetical protein IKS10_03585 [Lachnospiraceae bacterium]|nr:hypothetical protein [Lachnospiraceae bacterium]
MTERERALRIKRLKEQRRRAWRRMAIGLRLLVAAIAILLVVWLLVGVTKRVRMSELAKQNAQLTKLEEDLTKLEQQNKTVEDLIRACDEALAKYKDVPKTEQQKRLEQYEDEIVNLNHEIEDASLEAAEVQKQIAEYKKLLSISAKEEVTLPEPVTEEVLPTEENPGGEVVEQPTQLVPVEQPTQQVPVEQPTQIIEDDEFEHE